MRKFTRNLLKKLFPGIFDLYVSFRIRSMNKEKFSGLTRKIEAILYPQGEFVVVSGPFKGIRYINEPVWGSITPKWIGSYEIELEEVIEAIISAHYSKVVDVGCAEGYYAVGLAYRMPAATIIARDADMVSLRQVERLARINGVEGRVKTGGYITHEELAQIVDSSTVLIVDIEGSEKTFLDPDACPALRAVDILVEVHEFDAPEVLGKLLTKRFSDSHLVTEIVSVSREAWVREHGSRTEFRTITSDLLLAAADEHRGTTKRNFWLWMKRVNLDRKEQKL